MKLIGITQRVEEVASYRERRDCLDQRWTTFFAELGALVIALPNMSPELVDDTLDRLQLDGIVLSGGNSLLECDPGAKDVAPERDDFESALVDAAIERNIPILGVCRGMQFLNVKFGGRLTFVKNHIAIRHQILSIDDWQEVIAREVNSFHSWGISADTMAANFKEVAVDSDGCIEAFENESLKLMGIMWHPERESSFSDKDLALVKRVLL